MKRFFKLSNKVVYLVAFVALVSSNMFATSGSAFLFGEPKCPKSLIK